MATQSPMAEMIRALTSEDQDPAVVESVCQRVQQILTSNETIHYVAVQKRPVVNIAPDSIVLTNRRFIIYRPQLLGRISFEDHVWRNLQDARMEESIFRATVTMRTTDGKVLSIDQLPKVQARRVYAFAQEMEERVREERRRRELEDKRAAAGGVFLAGQADSQLPSTPSADPGQRLKALREMLDSGLITASEFEAKRAEIISKI